jgi:hypothetical protein
MVDSYECSLNLGLSSIMAVKDPGFVFMHMQQLDMQRLIIHHTKNVLVTLYI